MNKYAYILHQQAAALSESHNLDIQIKIYVNLNKYTCILHQQGAALEQFLMTSSRCFQVTFDNIP